MIRPFTCICMVLAAGSGLYLYQTKHRAQMLDREIGRVLKQTDVVRDRIGVLRGEWALLNEPDRLNELARQHLALRTMAPTQFVALADLGARLPVPLPAGSIVMPMDEPEPVPANTTAASAPPRPATPPIRPVPQQMAAVVPPPPSAIPVPPPATRAAPRPAAAPPNPAPNPAPNATPVSHPPAPAVPPPAPRITAPVVTVTATAQPLPGSIGESVLRVAHGLPPLPATSPPPAVQRAPKPSIIPAIAPPYTAPPPPVASALGGTRVAMPPPTPFASTR